MTPEKTNFITQGYDGMKRLKQGPMLDSYRGLNIIHSRQYSLETGAMCKTSGQDTKVLLDDGFEVSTLAARLPQLAGKGTVPDLRYVMN